MSMVVFEDPVKAEMRAACEVAIDQAGYQVASSPVKIPIVGGLMGSLVGDLQSLDANEQRTFYYVRPSGKEALPKWLANIARASHALNVGEVYVVVREYSTVLKQSCIAAGAGLLLLNEDSVFEVALRYTDVAPVDIAAAIDRRQTELRRSMERKLDLRRSDLEQRHHRVNQLVAEMDDEIREAYVDQVERKYKALEDWGEEVARRLDEVNSETSDTFLSGVEDTINKGPAGFEDEEQQ
ncbi:MAG: hypothetical protein ACKVOG_05110 [Rhodoglobus sp.]